MKLNVRNVRLWIRALRSGEFTQTRSRLRKSFGAGQHNHCCLGVVCELYSATVGGFFMENDIFISDFYDSKPYAFSTHGFKFDPVQDTHMLSDAMLKWLGLSDNAQSALVGANDSGWTFDQIANWLESALRTQRQHGKLTDGQFTDYYKKHRLIQNA